MREGRSVDLGPYRVGRPAYGHRPGTLDPGAVTYLMREHAMSAAEIVPQLGDDFIALSTCNATISARSPRQVAITLPNSHLQPVRSETFAHRQEREFSFDIKPPATTPGGNAEYGLTLKRSCVKTAGLLGALDNLRRSAAATYRASGFVPWHMAEQNSWGGLSAAGGSGRALPPVRLGKVAARACAAFSSVARASSALVIIGVLQKPCRQAGHHASKTAEKPLKQGVFSGQSFRKGETGAPILVDAPGAVECRVTSIVEHGDHHIIVGEVVEAHLNKPLSGRPDAAILEMKDLGDNVFYGG